MENLGLVGFTGAGANRLFSALTGLAAPTISDLVIGVVQEAPRAAIEKGARWLGEVVGR